MDFFWKDQEVNEAISWSELITDIKKTVTYNPYCRSRNYYQVFKQIVTSLMLEEELILLDSDFTDYELEKLVGMTHFESFNRKIDSNVFENLSTKVELINRIKSTSDKWSVTLFTSGTTGIPKKVKHDYYSITRFVRISDSNSRSSWGFAYNPTHMAGIQVFFQALLNGSQLTRLFGLSRGNILKEIRENAITHISATPSFYRLLLPCDDSFEFVTRITSGGEKFNSKTIEQLKMVFPNAKIHNVYASTETGTLFASENDIFVVKAEFQHLVKIVDSELHIHRSLVGSTEENVNIWYNTGDVIEVISDNPLSFRFVSRKSDMVNVGGYKVNPLEVEDVLLSFPEIANAYVYAKSNSVLGNIICCDIVCNVSNVSEGEIRAFLQSKLQEFKIPRIIRFVDELSTTRTGKLNRNKI